MPKRKHIDTSKEAHDSLKAEDIRVIYQKITKALEVLISAHTEAIAAHITLEHAKVHKRMKEMEDLGIVWKPGGKMPMKSGRNAYLWQLTAKNLPKTDAEVKYNKKQETAAEKAVSLIKALPLGIQQNLFQ